MTTVQAFNTDRGYITQIETATNSLVADEPTAHGGMDAGFNPEELLAASLAACTSITTRMYAGRKGIELTNIEVKVALSRNQEGNFTQIDREIKLMGTFTDEQKSRMLQIANNCPIHKILSNKIVIETKLL